MSITCFVLLVSLVFSLAPNTRQGIFLPYTIMQEQKKDTICRKMTPLGLRETNDQKKLEIIFSESPRFFTQQFSDLQMATDTRKKWNVWIRDKVKLTIYFTEEPGNTALIHKIGK